MPFPLAWTYCLFPALLWPFLSMFCSSSASPFLCTDKKHFINISNNKLANMSAAAGAQPDVAGNLAFTRARAAACWLQSLHGTDCCLERSRVGGGVSWKSWPRFGLQKQANSKHFCIGKLLWYLWTDGSAEVAIPCKKLPLILKSGEGNPGCCCLILFADLLESGSVTWEQFSSDLILQLP